jgi:phosphatidylglycerophosphatase A
MIGRTALPAGMTLKDPVAWLSTWFGCGLMTPASGTWGSAGAIPFAAVLMWLGGTPLLALGALIILAVGIWSSGVYAAKSGMGDPSQVVIDEVAGQWVTLCFVPVNIWWWLAAFLLFRAADIVKPFPANWCDSELDGGWGIMLDDIVAGLYAGIALMVLRWLI